MSTSGSCERLRTNAKRDKRQMDKLQAVYERTLFIIEVLLYAGYPRVRWITRELHVGIEDLT